MLAAASVAVVGCSRESEPRQRGGQTNDTRDIERAPSTGVPDTTSTSQQPDGSLEDDDSSSSTTQPIQGAAPGQEPDDVEPAGPGDSEPTPGYRPDDDPN